MDDAQAIRLWYAGKLVFKAICRVGGRGALLRSLGRKHGWSALPVQILVVVANIQLRTLKTEVEKVSV